MRYLPLLAVLALTACGWTGSGQVVEKDHRPGYIMTQIVNKVPITTHVPPCNRLVVVDEAGKEHKGCVNQETWDAAEVGDRITLTEDTKP